MSLNLQYNYAGINMETGLCDTCMTFSYEINHPAWIAIPTADSAYVGKYYNAADGLWYLDGGFTQLWEDAPQW